MSRTKVPLADDTVDDVEHAVRQARTNIADKHVGARVRERRLLAGLSQQQLAQMIGVAYQQAHKYERGLNRISAGRLYRIATVLKAPIGWFFEGLESEPADTDPMPTAEQPWTPKGSP